MTPTEAAKLLDLPAEASPEQLETRFNELRARLEDTMHGFKTLSAEEGEALGRKLTHVNGSEYQRPPPILP